MRSWNSNRDKNFSCSISFDWPIVLFQLSPLIRAEPLIYELPCEVGISSWAPCIPWTSWPEVIINCGIAIGWAWLISCVNVVNGVFVQDDVVDELSENNENIYQLNILKQNK